MVIKIHKPSPSMASNLAYNESKVHRGEAEIIWTENIGSNDPGYINEVFRARERSAVRDLAAVSFQMSINPGEGDAVREEDIPSLAGEMMRELGYGGQPWVLFRHHDIDRVHYHLVSIRVDGSGRKVRDHFEHRNCERAARGLARKYGYAYGTDGGLSPDAPAEACFREGRPGFRRTAEACVRDSLGYAFTSGAQFVDILRSHGLSVSEGVSQDDVLLRFQGLDGGGRRCTPPVTSREMGIDVYGEMHRRIEECHAMDLREEHGRLRALVQDASARASGFSGLLSALAADGVELSVRRGGGGAPSGVTVIDHARMHACGLEEVSPSLARTVLGLAEGAAGPAESLPTPVSVLAAVLGGGVEGPRTAPARREDRRKRKKKTGMHI